mgnify:CR=1 FL=1
MSTLKEAVRSLVDARTLAVTADMFEVSDESVAEVVKELIEEQRTDLES